MVDVCSGGIGGVVDRYAHGELAGSAGCGGESGEDVADGVTKSQCISGWRGSLYFLVFLCKFDE